MKNLTTTQQLEKFRRVSSELKMSKTEIDKLVKSVSGGEHWDEDKLTFGQMAVALQKLNEADTDKHNKMRTKFNAKARDLGYIKDGDFMEINAWLKINYKVHNVFELSTKQLCNAITSLQKIGAYRADKYVTSTV